MFCNFSKDSGLYCNTFAMIESGPLIGRRAARRASRSCSSCSWICSSRIWTVDSVGPARRAEPTATIDSRPPRPRRATVATSATTRRWIRLKPARPISDRLRAHFVSGLRSNYFVKSFSYIFCLLSDLNFETLAVE